MNYNEALKGRGSKLNRIVVDARSDADDKDGHWVTTESGKHMFINGEGEPTKGNPHVLAAANGESKPSSGSSASNSAGGNGGEKNSSKKSEAPATKPKTPNRYSEVADSMKKKAAANPNNLYYQEAAHNYEMLSKAADEFDSSAKEHAGMHTVVALERAKIGDVVEIKGSLFDGKYKLQNVKSSLSGRSGPAWVAQDEKNHKHSFGNDASTIMSEMRLIRGGKANDDKTKKVSFVS